MSRDNTRTSNEEGNPARLVVRESGCHDLVFATLKTMPFPLHTRDFVGRNLCATDTNGDCLLVAVPIDEAIDYGMSIKTVRGVARVFLRFASTGESQCDATFVQYLDAGGVVPTWVIRSKMPLALSGVGDLRDRFQRDDEIDKLAQDELASCIRHSPQIHTAEEEVILNKVSVKLGMLELESFEELESPHRLVRTGKRLIEGSSNNVGRATAVVDASVAQCAAWEMAKMSREQVSTAWSLERSLTRMSEHRSVFHVVYDFGIPGFTPREFLTYVVWRRRGDNLTVIYDGAELADFAPKPAYVQGTSTAHYEYEKLQAVGDVPQTRVTYTQQVNLGGLIPTSLVNGQAANNLMYLSAMRKRFDKSREKNSTSLAMNVRRLMGNAGVEYSEEENRILAEGEKHLADFKQMKTKQLEMASPLTKAELAHKKGDPGGQQRLCGPARRRYEAAPQTHTFSYCRAR